MRQNKTTLEEFSLHDHIGITAHMEKQARKGWMLDKIGRLGWRYRRIEPQNLKFAVTYFPPASVYDPEPTEQELSFQDYCAQAGWKLAASSAQLQIFYNEDPDAVPLETDALLQVENIHAAVKKTSLVSHWLMGVIGLLNLIFWLVALKGNPIAILADYSAWFRLTAFANLLALCAVELISYYSWHKKAVKLAEETGQLHPTKSHRVFKHVSLIFILSAMVLWFACMQSRQTKIVMLVSLLNMTLLMLAVQGCQQLLKKLKVPKNTNKVITLAVDFALAFLLVGILPNFIMKMDLSGKTPVDTYELYGSVRNVYNDTLPVTVEELMDVDPTGYSKELEVRQTVLAAIYDGSQLARRDREPREPGMDYRFAICKLPALTVFCWNGWLEDYGEKPIYRQLEYRDPTPWKAEEAYRVLNRDGDEGDWLIRWEDRFVRLTADWELTEEQMTVLADGFLNCEKQP